MLVSKLMEKWNNRISSLSASGMSETDDPNFAIELIKEMLKDVEECWELHAELVDD